MGKTYRVIVEDQDGATVLELMAPAAMLVNFGPAALAAVLDVKEPEGDSPMPGADQESGSGMAKERRRRRTKAEMEAARAKTTEEIRHAEGGERAEQYETVTTRINNGEVTVTQPEAPAAYNPFG